ncbi:MAG: hypothetical protein H6836_06600 [Planctomycetes bacterium]|nr:hypothetical protein [Planctomycetota bacterium]
MSDAPTQDLGTWLRENARADSTLTLDRPAVQALWNEMRRLQQSSDRLRRQNAKLRRRLTKAGDTEASDS